MYFAFLGVRPGKKDSSSHCWEAFEALSSWLSAWLSINLAPTQNWLSDYIKQEDGCLCGSCPWTLLGRMTGLNLLITLLQGTQDRPAFCGEGMPWKAGLFSRAVSSSNKTIGVQSSARAAFLSRTPHGIGTPTLLPECWRTETDRSSHSEVACCTLLHSYTKQKSFSLSLFLLCLFLKGEFLLHSGFFPFASCS